MPIEAPLNANVWKVLVQEGDTIDKDRVVVILEAMKLEIAVRAEEQFSDGTSTATVEKILVKPNDVIQAGKPLMLVRRKHA